VQAVTIMLLLVTSGRAQQLDFPNTGLEDPAALSKFMPRLAGDAIAVYKEQDRGTYLDNLFALQLVAGQYPEAVQSVLALRQLRGSANPERSWLNLQYEVYARAKAVEAAGKLSFEQAYKQSFREVFAQLDSRTSALAIRTLMVDESGRQPALQSDLEKQKSKSGIALMDALALVRDYRAVQTYRDSAPLLSALIVEDDGRRYVTEKDIQVKTADGARVCAQIMRPRGAAERLPTLMEFTIYNDANPTIIARDMRRTASNGYVSVVGFTRGKACSPDELLPYEHDGADATTLIDWIAKQGWSDGRVGMYGGSYSGFTPWATAKFMPKGLKAIMVGAAAAPGVDVPMEGNIVWNFIYTWPLYAASTKTDNDAIYNDVKRWQTLETNWYTSGRAFRDLDKMDGLANPIWERWIAHPAYDSYWQSVIPYKQEFARINIPVLNTAGYYYGGPGAAVYYFREHLRYNPKAKHYLLIGPYDHFEAQRGTRNGLGQQAEFISGYKRDPAALIDLVELRYQWFDYVLKGGPKPAILQDRVNYEVTGANVWKHAPSLAAMATQILRFHLSAAKSDQGYRLSRQKDSGDTFVDLKVDLADRSDADRNAPGGGVLDKTLDSWNGIEFISDPLPGATEMSGLFSGQLVFVTNKTDFDFEIDLYERTPHGDYVQLAPYWARASYVGDLSHRRLLVSGQRQLLEFQSVRLMSRQLQPGSRVVAVLKVIKESGRQINYGTGKDVSDETIQDAKVPLQIRWYSDSYVDLPVRR